MSLTSFCGECAIIKSLLQHEDLLTVAQISEATGLSFTICVEVCKELAKKGELIEKFKPVYGITGRPGQ